ncbi:efflux RND transporter periplasmic adaptor subunit [Croceibacterium sp. TMG7-5b_MA50]|uniref:efflux RND transporter periplasmic adaptor subunit n=1 Tax=Croceibacterium sp. TMG7-5b_MA50 TaxID=3121290 RepID=UPI003221D1E8
MLQPSAFARFLGPVVLSALLCAACADGEEKGGGRPRAAPLVEVVAPRPHDFVEVIEAVGTARANEQVTISAPVTERIERLHFDDGQYVRRGQLLATLAQGQEQAVLAAANATGAQSRAQLDRIQALSERGFATTAQLDTQVAIEARARAEADEARAQIADRTLRAPLSGAVSLRTISAGSIVAAGSPIAVISDLSRIKVDFTVPETQLRRLRMGDPIEVRSAAFPGEVFGGRIATIDPVLDPATRAVMVRAVLPNPDARLKPGMLLEVAVQAATRPALAVPEMSVTGEGANRFVFVVDDKGVARRRQVRTGLRDAGVIEVAGVEPGMRVVSRGIVKVEDGMTVRIADQPRRAADAADSGPARARVRG